MSVESSDVITKPGNSLRLSTHEGCQAGCIFCHNEGNIPKEGAGKLNADLVAWKQPENKETELLQKLGRAVVPEDVENAIKLAKYLNLGRIAVTGGEPALHPNILEIIKQIKESGLEVSLTTNAEYSPRLFEGILLSGLSKINISIQASTPEEYLWADLIAQQYFGKFTKELALGKALAFAESRLNLKLKNIKLATELFKDGKTDVQINTNTVVIPDNVYPNPFNLDIDPYQRLINILFLMKEIGVSSRIQRDANNDGLSQYIVNRLLKDFNSQLIKRVISSKDSSMGALHYQSNLGLIIVRETSAVNLDEMCADCSLLNTPDCRLRFYGIQVSGSEEPGVTQISTCFDIKEAGKTVFGAEEFFKSISARKGIPYAIANQYLGTK